MEVKAKPRASYAVDDALCPRRPDEAPANARFVGFKVGNMPVFCAVWSYLGVYLDDIEAEELAIDYLTEIGWAHREVLEAYVIV